MISLEGQMEGWHLACQGEPFWNSNRTDEELARQLKRLLGLYHHQPVSYDLESLRLVVRLLIFSRDASWTCCARHKWSLTYGIRSHVR